MSLGWTPILSETSKNKFFLNYNSTNMLEIKLFFRSQFRVLSRDKQDAVIATPSSGRRAPGQMIWAWAADDGRSQLIVLDRDIKINGHKYRQKVR